MSYDPFERGPNPVGVTSDEWRDALRGRTLPVEIWYPATAEHAGQDLDPALQDQFVPGWVAGDDPEPTLARQSAVRDANHFGQRTPLVLLVHGWAGFRHEATFIGTHLASHGYTVVSPDVVGSTFPDVDAFFNSQEPRGRPEALNEHLRAIAQWRIRDVPFLLDEAEKRLNIDASRVGITGASFGGWTSLAAPGLDARIAASVPMCPAGGHAHVLDQANSPLKGLLSWDWHQPVPTLMLVGARDCLLPLDGQLELLRKIPSERKRMVILADADHNHFVDDIEVGQAWLKEYAERVARLFPDGPGDWEVAVRTVVPQDEICPEEHAHVAWRGLTLAHMDAHLRANASANDLVLGPIDRLLAERGITANVMDCAV